VALQVPVGGGEGVLHGVLCLLTRAEHVAAEREDARAVALECDLEGQLVPMPDLLDEPLVAGEREQPLRAQWPERRPSGERSRFHDLRVVPIRIAHKNAIG
jgi:hypothetical protein